MKTPLVLQSESAECGLACLAMISGAHGRERSLSELRRLFPISLKGLNLQQLVGHAATLDFSSRALKLELEDLGQLARPCILHWDLNHFVVLKGVSRKEISVLDPAFGERKYSFTEASRHFTGVAVEMEPNAQFQSVKSAPRFSLRSLTGKISGLQHSLLQIFAVAVALEILAIVAPLMNQLIIDDVIATGDQELLTVLILGFGLLLICQCLVAAARSWMIMVLSQTLSLQWTRNVFAHLIKLPIGFFEKRRLGDITSRFGSVSAIQKTLTTSAIEAILDGAMALAALCMMGIYSVPLMCIVLAAACMYGSLRWLMYGQLRAASAERLSLSAKEQTHFLETMRAIAPLKLFCQEGARLAHWQNLAIDVQNRDFRTNKLNIVFTTGNTLIFGLENLLVLWIGAKLIVGGQLSGAANVTVGMLFAFVAYKLQFTTRISALINYVVDLKMLALHAERLADIALEPPEQDDAPRSDLAHIPPSLELKNVSFRYSEGEPWILKNANLKVSPGESLAIIGPSGSGKTTLLKIVLGLLAPQDGEILYGGKSIRNLGIGNFRRQIGTVMQEDALLTGSIMDNITFFDTNPVVEQAQDCARQAQIHADIIKMPMGYQTLIGDLGSGLSGGQKQRLLLARALYKQPKVLALDEATSHLDVANEKSVTQALARMNITRLVIAHRPETIAGATRVVLVSDGEVCECRGPELQVDNDELRSNTSIPELPCSSTSTPTLAIPS